MHDIEQAIHAQKQDNMRSDVLDIPEFGDHIKLGQDGSRLQPYGEGPEYSIERKLLVDPDSHHKGSQV